jgi:hypothetical protein
MALVHPCRGQNCNGVSVGEGILGAKAQGAPACRGASGTSQGVSGQLSYNFQRRENPSCHTPLAASRARPPPQARPSPRPEGGRRSARPTPARGVAASRVNSGKKEDRIIIFFLQKVRGNGGLWQVSEAPKYFGGGPHSHPYHTLSISIYLSIYLSTEFAWQLRPTGASRRAHARRPAAHQTKAK